MGEHRRANDGRLSAGDRRVLTFRFPLAAIARGDAVLDLGCGAGRHSFEALRRGAFVVAADLDDAVLKDVKAMVGAMSVAGEVPPPGALAALASDALRLPFGDGTFDVVIASEVLEHIPDDRRAMSELARVAKRNGRVLVSVPRWWPELVCWALSRAYRTSAGGHVRIYRSSQLVRRLRAAGLRVEARHHTHALHAPYWWLKCVVGIDDATAEAVARYHRFLVRDIESPKRWVRLLEAILNPILGKSVVLYLRKDHRAA